MTITALLSDLIFESKIRATAKAAGVDVSCTRDAKAALQAASSGSALIVDLDGTADALSLVRAVKETRPDAPIVGFLSHVQVELASGARAAGIDEVMPRSRFTEQLPEILRRLSQV
jgi:DNA-binding NarL/FixJ family response regulator